MYFKKIKSIDNYIVDIYNDKMKYKYLGKTGIKVSELCFGTMSFGGIADKDNSREMYNQVREAGINFFDCANVYQKGIAEEFLGEFSHGERNDLIISSKTAFPMSDKINDQGASRKNLTASLHASLKRLRTDYIDIYFIHRFDKSTPIEEVLRVLQDFISQGKILYLGVSNFAAWQVSKAMAIAEFKNLTPFHCIQPMYNITKRQAEVELFPMAEEEGLGVISYSPLGGGLLTGKYGTNKVPDKGRLLDDARYSIRYGGDFYSRAADSFLNLAESRELHPVSLAVAWAASHPAVTAPIIGARNSKQLTPSLEAVKIEIDGDLKSEIDKISPPPPPATDRTEEKT
jgi:aryl-alcohol dehydrogenase-like predicted oxidoreductase